MIANDSSNKAPDSSNKIVVEIKDIKCHRLPKASMLKNASKFYVKLILDGVTEKTAVAERGDDPIWNETFIFYANGSSSSLRLEVYAHHLLQKNDCVGVMEGRIDSLLSKSNSDVITRGLDKCNPNAGVKESQCTVEFTITSTSTERSGLDVAVSEAKKGMTNLQPSPDTSEVIGKSTWLFHDHKSIAGIASYKITEDMGDSPSSTRNVPKTYPGGYLLGRALWIQDVDVARTTKLDISRLLHKNTEAHTDRYDGSNANVGMIIEGDHEDMISQYDICDNRIQGIMRLVDVDTNAIYMVTNPKAIPKYAAISHSWKETRSPNPHSKSILKSAYERMTKNVRDMSLKLMWLDVLSLDQENPSDVAQGIRNMDIIYSKAHVTICDIVLHDDKLPLGSLLHNMLDIVGTDAILPQKALMNVAFIHAISESTWMKRAWTVQEALLSTSLIFSINGFSLSYLPIFATIKPVDYETWKNKPGSQIIEAIGGIERFQEIYSGVTGTSWWSLASTLIRDEDRAASCFKIAAGRLATHEEDLAYCLMSMLESDAELKYGIGIDKALEVVLRNAKRLPSTILGAGSWRISSKANGGQRFLCNRDKEGDTHWMPTFIFGLRSSEDEEKAIMWTKNTCENNLAYFVKPGLHGLEIPRDAIIPNGGDRIIEYTINELSKDTAILQEFILSYNEHHPHDDSVSRMYSNIANLKEEFSMLPSIATMVNYAAKHTITICRYYILQNNRYDEVCPEVKRIITTPDWRFVIFDDGFGKGDSFITLSYGRFQHGVVCKTELKYTDNQGCHHFQGMEMMPAYGEFLKADITSYDFLH